MEKCQNGNYIFDGNFFYRCTGQLSGFGNCNKKVEVPERRSVEIPAALRENYPFLETDFKVKARVIHKLDTALPTTSTPKQSFKFKRTRNNKEMMLKGIYCISFNSIRLPIVNASLMFHFPLISDGAIVDPGSGLQAISHVYIEDEMMYSEVLDNVDLSNHRDKNSFYKLQLLESDDTNPRRQVKIEFYYSLMCFWFV